MRFSSRAKQGRARRFGVEQDARTAADLRQLTRERRAIERKLAERQQLLTSGGGNFSHAPRTGDLVKISSLSEPYRVANWVGARRIR